MLHGNPKSMWRRLLRKSCDPCSVTVINTFMHCNPVIVSSTPIRCIHPAPVSTSSQDNHSSGVRAGRLNHIAIAVPNVEEAAQTFEKVLGSKVSRPQLLREHGVKVVFVSLENTKLELLEPLGEASPISKFLMKNPVGGMHHLCIEVPDIEEASSFIKEKSSVRQLDDRPKIGAHGNPVVFLHPKDMHGVLTELEQVQSL